MFTGSGVASAKQTGRCGLNTTMASLPPSAQRTLLPLGLHPCQLALRCSTFWKDFVQANLQRLLQDGGFQTAEPLLRVPVGQGK